MSGASFTLVYQSFGPSEWDTLGTWISSLAGQPLSGTSQSYSFDLDESVVPRISRQKDERHPKRTSEYTVDLRAPLPYPKADHDAIVKSLGYVPAKSLSIFAMTRDAFNIDGLIFLQRGVVERFGGWFAFEGNKLPAPAASLERGLVVVNVADYASYFGPGPVDPDYAAQYEEFVPKKTLYFVDAKLTGFQHLDV